MLVGLKLTLHGHAIETSEQMMVRRFSVNIGSSQFALVASSAPISASATEAAFRSLPRERAQRCLLCLEARTYGH